MTNSVQNVIAKNLLMLLKETFETGGSIYLDEGAALLPTLDTVSAEAASQSPCAGGQTIAAHAAHLAYYVRVSHNFMITGRSRRWTGGRAGEDNR